ncbi:MAG TPA: hypothetical protein VMF61_00365 [Candidatus Acidoferrales bacterium]|nr:hypothetical protein [Candidatus Acidoferrales bacterium]
MPRANPHASFEAAAKHLFRHIADPLRLRENPLTACFFEESPAGRAGPAQDRTVVARIHDVFRAAARRYRDLDLAAGSRERALRQYAIAVEGCLNGRPVPAHASELGVSQTQYYRERAAICERIARYFREAQTPSSAASGAAFDEFRFRMNRAAGMAELGDLSGALDAYERVSRSVALAAQKIEVLAEIALVRIRSGPPESPDGPLRAARAVLESGTLSERERRVAHARLEYAEGMDVWLRAPAEAMELFSTALARLEQLDFGPADPVRTLYVRILFEYGEGLTTFHDIDASVRTLSRVRTLLAASCGASPIFSIQLELTLQAFRHAILSDPCGWQPLSHRARAVDELSQRAHASGSVDLRLRALNATAQIRAASGDAAAALRAAEAALSLAKLHPTRELFSEVSLRMARTLMYTPLWRKVPDILRRCGEPASVAVASSRKTLEAEFALRHGRYQTARDLISEPECSRRPYKAMLAAQAADALGRRREALSLIEPALPAVERAGIGLTLGLSYRIASRITSDRRYGRKADEIERALTA